MVVVGVGDGEAPDVHRLALGEADVDEADAELVRDIAQDGGLPDAGGAPDHQRGELGGEPGVGEEGLHLVEDEVVQLLGADPVVHVERRGRVHDGWKNALAASMSRRIWSKRASGEGKRRSSRIFAWKAMSRVAP